MGTFVFCLFGQQMWRPPEQWAMICMSCEFLSKMCVCVWGRAGFLHGMPIQVSYPSLTLKEMVNRKRRFIRESGRTYSCWLNERKSEDSTRLWYSHKSRLWQAPVTTSKDKKTKQIVEIFLRGHVVWRHINWKRGVGPIQIDHQRQVESLICYICVYVFCLQQNCPVMGKNMWCWFW